MANTKLHPFWNEKIKYLSLQKPLFLKKDDSIASSIAFMQKNHKTCILISSSKGHLQGIVTERDFMRLYRDTEVNLEEPLSKIMTTDVSVISPEEDIATVMDLFAIKKFRHFPVCEDDKICGLLSVRVLIDFIAENIPEETLNLPPILGNSPKEPFGA